MYSQSQDRQSQNFPLSLRWRLTGVIIVTLFFALAFRATPLLAAPGTAGLAQETPTHDGDDDIIEAHGNLDSRPDGKVGPWVIDGKSYEANENTELDDENGALEEGACVFVRAQAGDPAIALRIKSFPENECEGHDDDEIIEDAGILSSRPADGKVGPWVINGKSYEANENTELDDENGALEEGACVFVRAQAGDPAIALKIKSLPEHECEGNGGEDDFIVAHGILSERPMDGKVGTWVIDGKSYEANDATQIEEFNGGLPVGACVEVKVLESAPTIAVKIRSLPEHECDGHDGEDDLISHVGNIDSRPEITIGVWIIDGKPFSVTENTVLDDGSEDVSVAHDGDGEGLEVGDCVEVKALRSDPTTAVSIEAKEESRCDGDDDDDEDESIKRYGRIESRPVEPIGTWVIDGKPYSVTAQTELEQEHGRLDVGTCVKVVVLKSEPTVAREIESEDDYKCSGRDDDDDDLARGMLFGVVRELPADLHNGNWVVSDRTFVVSPTTEIITNGGTITVGSFVKIDFLTDKNDVNYARRIELKVRHDECRRDGDDHDNGIGNEPNTGEPGEHHRYGRCPGSEGKTYGLIDFRPTDQLTGTWGIGGIEYLADDQTDFYPTDDYLVGERVKVEFVVNSDGSRTATSIKETLDNGGLSDPTHSKLVGFVDDKPAAFVGDWVINGVPFVADLNTVFLERAGVFAEDAYVVVEYAITNDMRLITEIRTHVPPGAGDTNQVGTLESINSAQVAGISQPNQSTQVWTVSGVNYTVTEATQIIASSGELVEGDQVFVNSYSADGQQIATLIQQAGGKAFIPFAQK